MKLNNSISWKTWVITLALQMVPAYAQAYMDETGQETYRPPIETHSPPDGTTEVKPEKKEKVGTVLKGKIRKSRKHAIFSERFPRSVRGTSSNKKVTFSATEDSGQIVVSFVLNRKEFRYVYDALDFKKKKMDLRSIELIPDSPEDNTKNKRDQALLALLTVEVRRDINRLYPLEYGILASLELLTGMFPQDEPVGKIDFHEEEEEEEGEVGAAEQSYRKGEKGKEIRKHSPDEIIRLCSLRGSSRSGTFDSGKRKKRRVYRQSAIVGDPASECLGRCGIGCLQTVPSQARKRQYTQACFAHDLCVNHFGQIGGKCANEFEGAQDDYLFAADCAFHVVGKWEVEFDWGCDGLAVDATTITYYLDYRFTSSAGVSGRWELNGDGIIRTYDYGTKYTGTIEASNMETRGTILSPNGSTGCFTDTYLTTSQ